MRRTLARFLLVALTTTAACSKPAPHAGGTAPPADKPSETIGDVGAASGSGASTTTSLDEGKLGKKDQAAANAQMVGGVTTTAPIAAGRYGTIGHGASGTGMGSGSAVAVPGYGPADRGGTESYTDYGRNAWTLAAKDHLSTFAVDVDTASYTIARRKLTEGQLPPQAAVRVEEFVNYFRYAYPAPDGSRPFSVTMDAAPSPFAKDRTILRVGLASKPKSIAERKPANLVFLVDVSGSMDEPDKLPLAKRSLRILVDNLKDGDTVALVTYAGRVAEVLPPTGLDQKGKILAAIEDLGAGGSTAMASGIDLAYKEAARGLRPGAISRVLVLTDGDANVGPTSHDDILKKIAGAVKEGVTLSTVGFGMGNYKDDMLEQLADKGNGNAFYIDGISAAKRIFQEQLGSTLEVVAKDVKVQVDFDADLVKRYRLIGYENRDIADTDFRNDQVDAGEIGAGHQVTALYEVEWNKPMTAARLGGHPPVVVRVRNKTPRGTTATEAAYPFAPTDLAASFEAAPTDLRFSFSVAAFADVLRGGTDAQAWSLKDIRAIAKGAAGADPDRAELVGLIDRAIALQPPAKTAIAR